MPVIHMGTERPQWLAAVEALQTDGVAGHRVFELLPAGYEAYLRIFHPFLPWDADPELAPATSRRTWKSLAEEAGATYSVELTTRSLEPAISRPEGRRSKYALYEGRLDPLVRRALFGTLARYTRPQTAWFYYGLSAIIGGQDRESALFTADLADVEAVVAAGRAENFQDGTPELVWPDDRSWIVSTDYDLTSTYLACSSAVADAVVNEPQIEALRATLQTRVDNNADDPIS